MCFQDCVSSAKQLCYMIKSRHPIVVTDAELSIIKVAQLENISIFTDHQHNKQHHMYHPPDDQPPDHRIHRDNIDKSKWPNDNNNNARISTNNGNNNIKYISSSSKEKTIASPKVSHDTSGSRSSISTPNTILVYTLSHLLLMYLFAFSSSCHRFSKVGKLVCGYFEILSNCNNDSWYRYITVVWLCFNANNCIIYCHIKARVFVNKEKHRHFLKKCSLRSGIILSQTILWTRGIYGNTR